MNNVLFSNEVFIFLSVSFLTLALLFVAAVFGFYIYKNWDFNAGTVKQYKIEKQSYLIVIIIFFALCIKIVMLPYFAFTIDSLSQIVSGAMCAAGVLDANRYGVGLLSLKSGIIFFVGLWLVINKLDIMAVNYPYMKKKLLFAVFIFLFTAVEFCLELFYFTNIVTDIPVQCCSIIYSVSGVDTPLPFGMSTMTLLTLFYICFLFVLAAGYIKKATFSFIVSVAFFYLGYYALVYFFGTYIYRLPTHICAFCMLQQEYYFIGYLLWGTLFLGVFFGTANFFLQFIVKESKIKYYNYTILFYSIFTLVTFAYVAIYYYINGVFLQEI